MKSINTTITIAAPTATVWEHLVDFDTHADWNPFFASIEGRAEVGSTLVVTERKADGSAGMVFRPTVLVADPERELRWMGKLAFGGLFDGTHIFRLTEQADGSTLLEHGEEFRGILIPFMGRVLRKTEVGFGEFNRALAARVGAACSA